MNTTVPILTTEHVSKTFTSRTNPLFGESVSIPALSDVALTIEEGDTLGLVGESGSGKSTIARLILRLIEPTTGTIRYKGEDLDDIFAPKEPREDRKEEPVRPRNIRRERRFRKEVQMVFQDPASTLNPRISVQHILEEPLTIHNIVAKEARQKRIQHLLDLVELGTSAMHRFPHEFSGGQRQRIGVARALATEPDMIILDEPVSALDISIQSQILNLLSDLKRELSLTYLFISHDLNVVKYLSNKVVVLYLGRVMEAGDKEEIFNNPMHPYTELLLRSSFSLEARGRTVDLTDDIMLDYEQGEGCVFYKRCPKKTDECRACVTRTNASETHYAFCIHSNR